MSDNKEILINMSRDLGNINGSLDTYIEAQKITNDALFKLIALHSNEIKSLNAVKNKTIGASMLVGGISAACVGFIAFVSKLIHLGGH